MKPTTYGKWLKIRLAHHGVAQKEFAREICVSENTVTSWTRDDREPGVRNFLWTCKYFAILEEEDPDQQPILMAFIILEAGEYF